jgi:plasmid stabilization system protein ParE
MARLLGLGPEPAWTKAAPGEAVEVPGAVRASLGVYNTEAEVDLLADALATLASEAKAGSAKAPRTPPSVALRERPKHKRAPATAAKAPARRIAARGR